MANRSGSDRLINFRYHLVSLTAVFLALALGVAMGAAVVDRALVSTLEDQLQSVESRSDSVNDSNELLETAIGNWDTFAAQAGDRLVAARLTGVPVALITIAGVDRDVVGRMRAALQATGATPLPEVVLTAKFALEDTAAARELAATLDSAVGSPAKIRSDTIDRLVASWAGAGPMGFLGELQTRSFAEVTPSPADSGVPEFAALAPRYLVVSSASADVANEELAGPLVTAMAAAGLPVVAADVTRADDDARDDTSPEAPFVGPLRDAEPVRSAISTVDHAAGFRGRVAAVLALVDLGDGKVGQYGTAPGAERLLPD